MTSIFSHIHAAEEERDEEERHRNQRRRHSSPGHKKVAHRGKHTSESHTNHRGKHKSHKKAAHRGVHLAEARLTKTGMQMKEVTSGYKDADRAFLVKNADVFKVSVHESTRNKYRLMRKRFHDASNLVRVFVIMLIIYTCFFIVMVIWMFIQMVVEREREYFVGYMTMGACMWVFGLGALYVAMKV